MAQTRNDLRDLLEKIKGDAQRALAVNVQSGSQLWAETYDRKLSDILRRDRDR